MTAAVPGLPPAGPGPVSGTPNSDERLARAALSRMAEPAQPELTRLVAEHGALAVWSAARSGDPSLGAPLARLAACRASLVRPEEDLRALARVGGRLLCPGDREWPPGLLALGDTAPLALWVRGTASLREAWERSVAVVGSRAATGYGQHVAAAWGAELAERAWTVCSGGAYGVDGAAHRGALAAGGRTVAVLACGVDVAYPPGHDRLLARIATQGLLVSEWPPGCAPMRHRFLVRNRVIAAATVGVVVVEAALRSGALSTAWAALRLGRTVMVVPGPITSAMSAGSNRLLRVEGVQAVSSVDEVVEAVGRLGTDLAPRPPSPALPRDDLSRSARLVLDAVPVCRGQGLARIAAVAGVQLAQARQCIGTLLRQGLVEHTAAGYRLAPAGRSAATGQDPLGFGA